MRRFLVVLSLSLLVFVVLPVHAQEAQLPPILALNVGGIYAISPTDGSAQTLVAPPDDYETLRTLVSAPITLFSADWLSPDGQYLAYRTLFLDTVRQTQAEGSYPPHELFVLDVQNGGEPLAVNLVGTDTAAANLHIQDLAWSTDGQRLYAVIVTSEATSVTGAGWSLVYVERGLWDQPVAVPLTEPEYAMARQLFAASDGMLLMDRGVQSPRYVFTLFDLDGQQVTHFEVDWSVSPDVNLYLNTPFTPLLVDDTLRFGLVAQMSGELRFQADLSSGEVTPFEPGYFSGMVSALAPETSLRVSASYFDGDAIGLLIRDADNQYVGDTPIFKAYAYGISGDSSGSTFAIAPDGQAVAYLENGALMLWQAGTAAALDFNAQALAWGPALNIPIYDLNYFRG